ncbi:MAG: glycosyltransferase family 9 protein [Verrucomicrobia bacterium]|nr:glycosyltransferase family 9 protein [Verrucomicrobiota bacterium]
MRILLFRGGALGDLILTLPVLASLRTQYRSADLRLFGTLPHARLGAGLAEAVYDLQAQAMTPLFVEGGELEADLRDVIEDADLAVSYLADSGGVVSGNLRRAGIRRLVPGPYRMDESGPHAIEQLAAPLALLGIPLLRRIPQVEVFSREGVSSEPATQVALHLGSGSSRKNWPSDRWRQLMETLLTTGLAHRVAVVTGEADEEPTRAFLSGWRGIEPDVWDHLPLPELARRLADSHAFFGHDSGVSHLAAATGIPVLALFGPTNPEVWSPRGPWVKVIKSPTREMHDLQVSSVVEAAQRMLC